MEIDFDSPVRKGSGASALSLNLAPEAMDLLLDRIAERVADRLNESVRPGLEAGWMDSQQAAAYLGTSSNALHKATSARQISFSQDGNGAKCWFRRADLDAFREQHLVERLDS